MSASLRIILIVIMLGAFVAAASAQTVNPYFRTDRAVDTRSAKSIVRDVLKPGMTDEEKVLALFHWLRRTVYHSGPEEPAVHDFGKLINVFGYGSCFIQTHPLSQLYAEAGYETKSWLHDGHHMLEVQYGGAWHCLDPHMTFYCYTRKQPRTLASVAELQEDETLAGEAVKEKRSGPAFLICGDKPNWFGGKGKWVDEKAFPKQRGTQEEFGGITLCRGMTYVRTWKTGKFVKAHGLTFSKDGNAGPYHTCGVGADRKDPVNFPYWEPYQASPGGVRHYGTGYVDYAPELRSGHWSDAAVQQANVTSDEDAKAPAIHPKAGSAEAELVLRVECPYIVSAAKLALGGLRGKEEGDKLSVAVTKNTAANVQDRKWATVHEAKAGSVEESLDLTSAVEGALNGYWVRITMISKDPKATGINTLKLHTDFQLNLYALPQLDLGKNQLFVTAQKAAGPWKFRLAWSQGEGWQKPQEYKAVINGTSHEASVDAAGPKLPRMETMEMSVEP